MQGVKGTKVLRINMAFADDVYRYITLMSKIKGVSMTKFVNNIIEKDMQKNEAYLKNIEAVVNMVK
jgi:hypothetical protein